MNTRIPTTSGNTKGRIGSAKTATKKESRMSSLQRTVISFGYDSNGRADFELDPDSVPTNEEAAKILAAMMRSLADQIDNQLWAKEREK